MQARQPAYWKAENLDDFDGGRGCARRSPLGGRRAAADDEPAIVKRWTQKIKVSIRNLRTDQFITAGYASDVDIPRLIDDPDARRAVPRRRARCAAATRTPRRSTRRSPTEAQRRRAGVDYQSQPRRLHDDLHRDRGRAGRQPRPHDVPVLRRRRRPDQVRPGARRARRRRSLARAGLARTYALSRELARRRADARGVRPARARLPRPTDAFTYSEVAAAGRRRRSTASCSTPSRATASSTRARWRCCCGWPASRRASSPASRPARPTPRPASTSCATSTRTPGSRPTTRAGAGSRSTRRPAASPARSQPADARERRAAAAPAASTSFGGDPLSERGAGVAGDGRAGAVVADPGDRRRRARAGRRSAALARAPLARAARRRRCPSSSARCGARAASRRPGTTLHALELRFAGTPAAAGYVRALRESRYRDEPSHPTRAQRRGLRSELGRGGGLLGRIRAWWALPPTVSRGLTIGRMDDVYDLYQRGMALLEDGHFHQATIPLAKARDLEPDKTSIREALGPGVLPLRRLRGGARGVRGGGRTRAHQRLRAVLPRAAR